MGSLALSSHILLPKTFDKAFTENKFTVPSAVLPLLLFVNSATRNNAMQVRMRTQLLSQV
jgi:hypothetical protein